MKHPLGFGTLAVVGFCSAILCSAISRADRRRAGAVKNIYQPTKADKQAIFRSFTDACK